jgi:formylglycine-generating enzyme required for sulfatase activity
MVRWLVTMAVGWAAAVAQAAPATGPALEVPQALLDRLRSQYVPEEEKTPTISEADKVRRYHAILREGALAERAYARAPNLHQVQEVMMAAAKGLATLEGTPESRRQLMDIVRRLAESDAPADARLMPDLLLTRARIDEIGDAPSEAAEEIEQFLARYAGGPWEYRAFIGGVELSKIASAEPMRRHCLRTLMRKHFSSPGVTELLEAEGEHPYHGRLMGARLTKLDGTTLSLPRDTLGKVVVLHFWTMNNSGLVSRRGLKMRDAYEKLRGQGVEFVGINLDTDRGKVAQFVEIEGLDWIQTCSGLAGKDPTLQRYRVPTVPAWWVISPDGRAMANSYRDGFVGHSVDWGGFVERLPRIIESLTETAARVPYYRSGEFLLDEAPSPNPTRQRTVQLLGEAVRRHQTPERQLASTMLAEFVRASEEPTPMEAYEKVRERIETFRLPYIKADMKWAADIMAVVLAVEMGDEVTRAAIVRELLPQASHPKVRGFLRDFCNINIDALTTPFEYQPLMTMAAGGEKVTCEPGTVSAELPRLDGGVFRLPQEARRKPVVIHFWSIAHAPEAHSLIYVQKNERTSLDKDVTVVAVNLDRSRQEVERFLKANPSYAPWVHIFSGQGWHDPLARQLDVCGLPRSVLIDRDGTIVRWGTPSQMAEAAYRAIASPPRRPPPPPSTSTASTSRPGLPATLPIEGMARSLSLDLDGRLAINAVLIPGGDFRMGPSGWESRRWEDELPQRWIFITKPFYLAPHPVTRGQFAAFVKDSGYATEAEQEGWSLIWNAGRWQRTEGASWKKPGFEQEDDHPVVCVSWNDAMEFCRWLGRKTGRAVRLPTESQWEYACRAGAGSIWPWGDDPEGGKGWCNAADASAKRQWAQARTTFGWDDGHAFTSPVGKFKANAFGLFDMLGNAWEWTADWFDKSYLWEAPGHWKPSRVDPTGPDSGTYRVTRGGSWQGGAEQCRPAARRPQMPSQRLNTLGFRVAVAAP